MRVKNFFRALISVSLALVLVTATYQSIDTNVMETSAATIADLEASLKENAAKQEQLKNDIAANKTNLNQVRATQDQVAQQIKLTEENIDLLNQQITVLEESIKTLQTSINKKQGDIDTGMEELRARLRAMYMAGNESVASVLIGSTDFFDMLSQMEFVKHIAKRDQQLIDNLTIEMDQLVKEKKELETQKTTVDNSKVKLVKKQAELEKTYSENSDLIEQYNQLAQQYSNNQAKYDKEAEELEAAIKKLIQQNQSNGYVGTGSYIWPVKDFNYVSSAYGWRWLFGKQEFHRGIDIAGAGINGQPIRAADSGTVILADSSGVSSYGKYVIIDHGNGQSTLYAHCSKLEVSVGQKVVQGSTIARVGATGRVTGPHLHFEVRINGDHTNPMNYFKKG